MFLEWKIVQTGESIGKTPWLILALMYTPAVASIIARLAFREGFGDVSFLLGGREGRRAILLAWIYPIVVGLLAYGTAWATGLAKFQPPLPPQSHLYTDSAATNLMTSLLLTATLGTLVSCVSAFGEELGWRGYMLTRLMLAGVPKPVLVSGLIWAFWHVPLILTGQYAAGTRPRLSAMLFVVGVVADGYLAAYVRLRSGSVWPAVIYHGAVNAVIQGTFDRATVGTPQAVGESGWLTATSAVAIVVLVTRGPWRLQRRPGEPLLLAGDRRASILTG
jgi:membrane protease YdiL (CAAX protease family)